eukprot:6478499-Amphidinium_carterae.1
MQQTLLRGVPTLMLPSETGAGLEKYYCFRAEDDKFKEITVKQSFTMSMQKACFKPDSQMWPSQALTSFETLVKKKNDDDGVVELLGKERISSFDEWFNKSYEETAEDDKDDDGERSDGEDVLGDLVGVAVSSLEPDMQSSVESK